MRSEHVRFTLTDPRDEPVLYLMTPDQSLTLSIENSGKSDLHPPYLSGSPHEEQHHFVLRFRAGVLEDIENLAVTGPDGADWHVERRADRPLAEPISVPEPASYALVLLIKI